MKTLILIVVFCGLIATSCSTTTYMSLTENNKEQIEQMLSYDEQEKDVGVEITLSLKNGTEYNGELLSIRENSVIICTEYSATDDELANRIYPIITIQNSEIKKLKIEGDSFIWVGIGYGALGGVLAGALVGYTIAVEEKSFGVEILGGGVIGLIVGAIAGGFVGNANSTDDVLLQDIPPGYDFSLLKPVARYPDEEPEYLKAIE